MKKVYVIAIIITALVMLYFIGRGPLARQYNSKGLIVYNEEKYSEAEQYFSRAVSLKGDFSEALINLVKSQFIQDKISAAEESLAKLLNQFPELAETAGLEGELLVKKSNYELAITSLNAAIQKDSLLAYTYFYRGIALANIGRLEEAAADYLKAQQIDQSNTKALIEGAIIYSKLENFEAAIQNYNVLLKLDPSNINAYLERANFKMKIRDFSSAIEDFDKVLELNSSIGEAFFNRGKSFAQWGKYVSAVTDFKMAAELKYKIASSNYNAGLASLRLGNNDQAIKYLEQCVDADANNEHASQAYHLLGVVNMMRQQNSKSIGYFNKSIELDNTFADAYYNRGIAHGLLKNYDLAIADLNSAIRLGKSSADVYFALGTYKISVHRTAEGCEDLAKAEEMGHAEAAATRIKFCKAHME